MFVLETNSSNVNKRLVCKTLSVTRAAPRASARGQFGYTANITKPPVVAPANPGLKFTPPPTFASNSGGGSGGGNKAAAVDCVVR